MLIRTFLRLERLAPRTVAAAVLFACAGFAADPFYLGTWKIASATPAPWSNNEYQPYQPEMKSLPGKIVVFRATLITGPRQVACKKPRYVVKDYPADMLFQGMLGEMHERNKSVDPVKEAGKVGFRGTSWKTLETGCETELDFHFIDPSTAVFALNNVVYTLKKE